MICFTKVKQVPITNFSFVTSCQNGLIWSSSFIYSGPVSYWAAAIKIMILYGHSLVRQVVSLPSNSYIEEWS